MEQILFDRKIDVAGERLGDHTDDSPDRVGFFGDVMATDDGFSAARGGGGRGGGPDGRSVR